MEELGIPIGPFGTIVADPPWPEKGKGWLQSAAGKKGSSSAQRYDLMSNEEIAALPVLEVAAERAHLYLWCTSRSIFDAREVAFAWGFRPVTVVTWVKTGTDGEVSRNGMGYYFKGATEFCVFAVRGKGHETWKASPPSAFTHPRIGHSVKPDWIHEVAEKYSPGPRLELYARRGREGWSSWGNEA